MSSSTRRRARDRTVTEAILLDTHIALWLDSGDERLRPSTRAPIDGCRRKRRDNFPECLDSLGGRASRRYRTHRPRRRRFRLRMSRPTGERSHHLPPGRRCPDRGGSRQADRWRQDRSHRHSFAPIAGGRGTRRLSVLRTSGIGAGSRRCLLDRAGSRCPARRGDGQEIER